MQVDLCVFLAGHKLEEYTPLFIETLFKNCDTSSLHIHVVEKGAFLNYTCEAGGDADIHQYRPVHPKIHEYLLRKKEESPVPFTIYQMHDPSVFFRKSRSAFSDFFQSDDHANTINWAMENCGTNKWMIVCHSDMIFVTDIVSALMNGMKDNTGLYGVYNHCFAVNRVAYQKVGIKFNGITNFRAVPVTHQGYDYVIRFGGDSRCTGNSKIIYGWDVGELLELMMIANGWYCEMHQFSLTDLSVMVEHLGSGHEYTSNDVMKQDHQSKRDNWMEVYGVRRIPL
jgi:hypothetical protein